MNLLIIVAPFVRSGKWREVRVKILVRILNRQTTQSSASNQRKPNKLNLFWLVGQCFQQHILSDEWADLNQAQLPREQSRSMTKQLKHHGGFPCTDYYNREKILGTDDEGKQ